jgi:hypothetical protein
MGKKKRKKRSGISWLKLLLELLVVFVGVTSGFLLNNYREERVSKEFENIYLENLLINLKADSAEIGGNIEANLNNVDVARLAVTSFRENKTTNDQALDVLSVMVTYNDISLQDASYQSIVGSGSLGLIGNIGLRMHLIEYYQFMDQVRSVEAVHNEYITSYVLPFVMKNMDMTGGRLIENFDLNSIEFRNLTGGYYVIENQKMEMSITLDSLNARLKERLTTQLNLN